MNPFLPPPDPLLLLLIAYLAWSLELDYSILRHQRQAILRIGYVICAYAVSIRIS